MIQLHFCPPWLPIHLFIDFFSNPFGCLFLFEVKFFNHSVHVCFETTVYFLNLLFIFSTNVLKFCFKTHHSCWQLGVHFFFFSSYYFDSLLQFDVFLSEVLIMFFKFSYLLFCSFSWLFDRRSHLEFVRTWNCPGLVSIFFGLRFFWYFFS